MLQVFRTAVCEENFKVPKKVLEKLRDIILNYDKVKKEEINYFPLAVNYIQTPENDFGRNMSGYTSEKNFFTISMCDFIIIFYGSKEKLKYVYFYGINTKERFKKIINYKEEKFKVNILSVSEREKYLKKIFTYFAKDKINIFSSYFKKGWKELVGVYPSKGIITEYILFLLNNNIENTLKFTQEEIVDRTTEFMVYKGF